MCVDRLQWRWCLRRSLKQAVKKHIWKWTQQGCEKVVVKSKKRDWKGEASECRWIETHNRQIASRRAALDAAFDCALVCCRRLNTLNKCASMKLDVSQPKKKVSQKFCQWITRTEVFAAWLLFLNYYTQLQYLLAWKLWCGVLSVTVMKCILIHTVKLLACSTMDPKSFNKFKLFLFSSILNLRQ